MRRITQTSIEEVGEKLRAMMLVQKRLVNKEVN